MTTGATWTTGAGWMTGGAWTAGGAFTAGAALATGAALPASSFSEGGGSGILVFEIMPCVSRLGKINYSQQHQKSCKQ